MAMNKQLIFSKIFVELSDEKLHYLQNPDKS